MAPGNLWRCHGPILFVRNFCDINLLIYCIVAFNNNELPKLWKFSGLASQCERTDYTRHANSQTQGFRLIGSYTLLLGLCSVLRTSSSSCLCFDNDWVGSGHLAY